MTTNTTTQYLDRGEGRIAYDVTGSGPLVVAVPGMGDLRSSYRHLAPALVDAGFRVATMDLRGHGDSDTTFTAYDDPATASDVSALIEHLGGPALVIGNSMGAAAGVIAAAEQPELISGLVLVGPFVRNPSAPAWQRLMFRAMMGGPWARMAWLSWYPTWSPPERMRTTPSTGQRSERHLPAPATAGHSGRPRTSHTHPRRQRWTRCRRTCSW